MLPDKITEQDSTYRHLDKMSIAEILSSMNREDETVPRAVATALPAIEQLITGIVEKMAVSGRLFYIGAGTSGRLGILDASECAPTFGVSPNTVIGIMAGGDKAIKNAVEYAEDDKLQGWKDLQAFNIAATDCVIGLTASGSTPYVLEALKQCNAAGILTGSISCNPHSVVSSIANFPVEVIVGPEFVTGSTRLKSGTAQKLVLNMISTATMIRLGKVEDNKMVHMQLSNQKLIERGVHILMNSSSITSETTARSLLLQYGSVKRVMEHLSHNSPSEK